MLTEGACQKHSDRTLQLLNSTIQASNKIGLFGPRMKPTIMSIRTVLSLLIAGIACFPAHSATGQELVVDSAHMANQLCTVRSLGGTVDSIKTKAADHALEQPMPNQILVAGWHLISYRQNTELEAKACHWNPSVTWSYP